ERVDPRPGAPPVERVAPVGGKALDERPRRAPRPSCAGDLTGPARVPQPAAQIVEHRLLDPDAERLGPGGHAWRARSGRDGQLVEEVDERAYGALPGPPLRVRRLDHEVLVGRVGAAAVAEAEMAGGELERLAGEDDAGIRARVARQHDRVEPRLPVDRQLRLDDRRV